MDTGRNEQLPTHGGRVVIDSRGRNVWQWNDDQIDSTSIVLKRLDNAELALEPTRRLRRLKKADASRRQDSRSGASRREPEGRECESEITLGELKIEQTFNVELGGGFDPYNRS